MSTERIRRLAKAYFAPVALMLGALFSIRALREPLIRNHQSVAARSDVYGLPAPQQVVAGSLGYRAALADMIYAHVLVSYGLHFEERRLFEFVGRYLDTINALDPKFRTPYRFADTLLTLQPVVAPREHYLKAREILERGMRERPYDGELWLTAGQFMAYLAPPQLSETEAREWRMAGARVLARACELVAGQKNLPYHCITAAGLFSRAGNREAAIQFAKRVLAVSDDPEIRERVLGYLKVAIGEREREHAEARYQRFVETWQQDLPFVSRDTLLVLGPRFDPAKCAGLSRRKEPACATSWRSWAAAEEARTAGEN